MSGHTNIIELANITKRFGTLAANDGITLDVRQGEVHTLLGENGAGKTTLMNILYGHLQPDSGTMRVGDQEVRFRSPRDAIQRGLGMVHQHFMLVPPLTVAENVVMGTRPTGWLHLDIREVEHRIQALAERHGIAIDPTIPVAQLSVGIQQRVEILKILYRDAHILILDEPTAVLTPLETEDLFRTLHALTEMGYSVIFISHKLNEVMAISHRITVLRQGRVMATVPRKETTPRELARMMVGREVFLQVEKEDVEPGEALLVGDNLSAANDEGIRALHNVSFEVRAGEILGFAGVEGNGQRELAEVLAGMRPAASGSITLNGEDVTGMTTRARMERGLAHIPENRSRFGVVAEYPVWENTILQHYYQSPFARRGILQRPAIRSRAEEIVRAFDVKTESVDAAVEELSGGNQQKLLVGRELAQDPLVLIAAQPTRGLDVGAIEYIHKRLLEQRAAGKALVLISTELEEVLSLSDRVAVLYRGEIIGVMRSGGINMNTLGLLMLGKKPSDELASANP